MSGSTPDAVRIVRDLRPIFFLDFDAPCNLDCFYCYDRHERVDLDGVQRAIRRGLELAGRIGYRAVAFESGELLLLPFWREVVEAAAAMGFEDRILVTNLTLLDEGKAASLQAAGINIVAGTLFGFDDEETQRVAGRSRVFSRQRKGIEAVLAQPGLCLVPHLMLTGHVSGRFLESVDFVGALLAGQLSGLVVSAIEPIAAGGADTHPCFANPMSLAWDDLLAHLDERGVFAVVQNLPACKLGSHAQRCYLIRKHIGRALLGLPQEEDLQREVRRNESLRPGPEPSGPCDACPSLAVCQRVEAYSRGRQRTGFDDVDVVRRLFREEGLGEDVVKTTAALRRILGLSPGDQRPESGGVDR